MPSISRQDTVFANNVFLPTQTYRVCVVKTELKESAKKKNPMHVLTCEIIEPEEVEHENQQVKITGQTFQLYLLLVPNKVGKQFESSMAAVWRFCDKTGVIDLMPLDENGSPEYKFEDHEEYYLGLEFDIPLSSEEKQKRSRQTPAQKLAGEPGDLLLDGEGNPQSDGWQIVANLNDVPENPRPSRREMAFQG